MGKKLLVLGMVAIALAAGCKKEETKVESTAPATAQQQSAAPQATATTGDLFKAEITPEAVPQSVKKGSSFEAKVTIKNVSSGAWSAKGPNSVRLSYHWREAKTNKAVIWDGKRTLLANDIAPGQEATVVAKVGAPEEAGNYFFELDMVQEKVGWFGKKGSVMSKHKIEVK